MSVNVWIGEGRLTKDAELKFTPGKGTPVARFNLAIDDGFGDNKKTNFLPVVVWGKSAEALVNYTQKGSRVLVKGKIDTRSYDNSSGQKIQVTEIVADMYGGITYLDNRSNNQSNESNRNSFGGNFDNDIIPINDGEMPF